MAKREIKLSELNKFILSPGNIFWKKNSGDEVLVSLKGDFCNLKILEKIAKAKQVILIEDEIEIRLMDEAFELMNEYKQEKQFAKIMGHRKKILKFLVNNFSKNQGSQFELNLIFWVWFGSFKLQSANREEENIHQDLAEKFLERDRDFFVRSLQLATGACLFAICLGYYDFKFLKNVYWETVNYFEKISKTDNMMTLKEKLTLFQKQQLENSYLGKLSFETQLTYFETENGLGIKRLVSAEMSELEKIMSGLNELFSYEFSIEENLVSQIMNQHLNVDKNILNMAKRELEESCLNRVG